MTKLVEGNMDESLRVGVVVGNINMIAFSLSNGANVNSTDKDGWTAIMHSSHAGNEDVTRLLLKNGADYRLKNPEGDSALELGTKGTVKIIREWIKTCDLAERQKLRAQRGDAISEIIKELERDSSN